MWCVDQLDMTYLEISHRIRCSLKEDGSFRNDVLVCIVKGYARVIEHHFQNLELLSEFVETLFALVPPV